MAMKVIHYKDEKTKKDIQNEVTIMQLNKGESILRCHD
jgi:hypothetical protein